MAAKRKRPRSIYIAAIGASAGGLDALQKLISFVPKSADNLALLVVQHLSPNYKSMLVQSLSSQTSFDVVEATHGVEVKAKTIYITPANSDISVRKGKILLNKAPRSPHPWPSINNLLITLAEDQKERAIGIILSGTGTDGALGLKKIREAGGIAMVQDPKTAKFNSMPQAAIETAHVDFVLTAENIGEQLGVIASQRGRPGRSTSASSNSGNIFEDIIALIAQEKGTDLQNYKSETLLRRIKKRMTDLKYVSAAHYYKFIEKNPSEVDELFNMMLIGVTDFFRDPAVFKALEKDLAALIDKKVGTEPLRVWIPGCSTGQEAYSLAILIDSIFKKKKRSVPVQIFATDIHEQALGIARRGLYHQKDISHLSAEVRKNCFIHSSNSSYEVSKTIRSMVLFSKHDLTRNPPFLKLDLIVCRNLLMYFNTRLQNFVFPVFYSALNPNGYLLLGKSESIGQFNDLFATVRRDAKLYQRKAGKPLRTIRYAPLKIIEPSSAKKLPHDFTIPDMVKETLYKLYEHPYVVVNDAMDIQEISGDVGMYIGLKQGQMNANLIKLAHKDLKTELRALFQKCVKEGKDMEGEKKKFDFYGKEKFVKITVRPLIYSSSPDAFYWVVFEEIVGEALERPKSIAKASTQSAKRKNEFEQELEATKADLQGLIERLEDSNSQLQSLNEELQSSNEELKISNEELETANEELQSANEEINIAYTELKVANETLEEQDKLLNKSQANIRALLNNKLQSFILLDKDYSIIALNDIALASMQEVFNTRISVGDNFQNLLKKKNFNIFAADLKAAFNGKAVSIERALADAKQKVRGFIFNFTPVLNANRAVESVSLSILDVTELKRAKSELAQSEKMVESVFHTADIGLAIINEKGTFIKVNEGYSNLLAYSKDELEGKPYHKILVRGTQSPEKWPALPTESIGKEDQVVNRKGTILDVFVTTKVFVNRERERFLIQTMRDVSDEKKYRELLFNTESMMHSGSFEYNLISNKITCTNEIYSILDVPKNFKWTVKNLTGFLTKEDRSMTMKIYTDLTRHRKLVEKKFQIRTQKNQERWVEVKIFPVLLKTRVIGFRGTLVDVTAQKKAEIEIERLSWVARHTNNGVVISDSKGKIEWVNKSFETITGYELEEVKGKTPGEILQGTDTDKAVVKRIAQQLKKKQPVTEVLLNYTKDKRPIWVRVDIAPIYRETEFSNFISVLTDLTQMIQTQESRKAQESLEQRQKLLDAMAGNFPDGILGVLDRNLNYVFVGGTELKKLGHNVVDMIGEKIFDKISPEANAFAKPYLEKVFEGKEEHFEVNLKGDVYFVSAIPISWEEKTVTRALVVIQNITQRKKAEHEVLHALTQQKELNELKSRFITLASHEFRTPLGTILSSADLITQYNTLHDEENLQKHIKRVKTSVKNLTEILNEFLSLSKIEEGAVRNNPIVFSIKEFSEELIEEIGASSKKGQVIRYEHQGDSDTASLDKQHTKNVLLNLLSNAVKYSAENTVIHFSSQRAKGFVKFVVQDEGIGIPEADKPHIFKTFFRAQNAVNIQGTGMGLHIIKRYLAIMGGTIEFESKLGEGSTFTVTLPQVD
jgi:two-component system, chemotaxis family, CheB/CheR fusion protein